MKAKYYNMKLGPTLLAGFTDKGYLVFIAYSRVCPFTGKMSMKTILVDGQCGLTNTGEIYKQIKNKSANKWHDVELVEAA